MLRYAVKRSAGFLSLFSHRLLCRWHGELRDVGACMGGRPSGVVCSSQSLLAGDLGGRGWPERSLRAGAFAPTAVRPPPLRPKVSAVCQCARTCDTHAHEPGCAPGRAWRSEHTPHGRAPAACSAPRLQRYKICPFHLELPCLVVEGQSIRFCQQCGRYQLLSDFDGDRRSCRRKVRARPPPCAAVMFSWAEGEKRPVWQGLSSWLLMRTMFGGWG
jgi:hypothetical protein